MPAGERAVAGMQGPAVDVLAGRPIEPLENALDAAIAIPEDDHALVRIAPVVAALRLRPEGRLQFMIAIAIGRQPAERLFDRGDVAPLARGAIVVLVSEQEVAPGVGRPRPNPLAGRVCGGLAEQTARRMGVVVEDLVEQSPQRLAVGLPDIACSRASVCSMLPCSSGPVRRWSASRMGCRRAAAH